MNDALSYGNHDGSTRPNRNVEKKQSYFKGYWCDLPSHNVTENRRIRDSYDWSTGGEEWTPDANWKTTLINEMMLKYIVKGSTALEIGIAAGRWS